MRIAQVAPLYESVPPHGYGGTERIVSYLTEELVPEPFGLVMIEALASGTPVIAFRRGSVSEVIMEGETGFIVDDIEGAVEGVNKIGQIDRACCRAEFETRFTDRRMAEDYLKLYQQLRVHSSQQQAA